MTKNTYENIMIDIFVEVDKDVLYEKLYIGENYFTRKHLITNEISFSGLLEHIDESSHYGHIILLIINHAYFIHLKVLKFYYKSQMSKDTVL